MIHSESCSPRTFLTRKNSISKKKNKPSSVPVGFLNILSVPDPSGNYLVYANLALTIFMYIKNIRLLNILKNSFCNKNTKKKCNVQLNNSLNKSTTYLPTIFLSYLPQFNKICENIC